MTETGYARAEQLQTRLIEFGARCCRLARDLRHDFAETHCAKQLVRAATAPAAHYAEACHAESRRDFAHKVALCAKELREAGVWLRFLAVSRRAAVDPLQSECSELLAIFVASAKTARWSRAVAR